jgi:hypothetical protein
MLRFAGGIGGREYWFFFFSFPPDPIMLKDTLNEPDRMSTARHKMQKCQLLLQLEDCDHPAVVRYAIKASELG